jgi:hypothetical protein
VAGLRTPASWKETMRSLCSHRATQAQPRTHFNGGRCSLAQRTPLTRWTHSTLPLATLRTQHSNLVGSLLSLFFSHPTLQKIRMHQFCGALGREKRQRQPSTTKWVVALCANRLCSLVGISTGALKSRLTGKCLDKAASSGHVTVFNVYLSLPVCATSLSM